MWTVTVFTWAILTWSCIVITHLCLKRTPRSSEAPAPPAISLDWSYLDHEIQISVCEPPPLYLVCVNPDDSVAAAREIPGSDVYMCEGRDGFL